MILQDGAERYREKRKEYKTREPLSGGSLYYIHAYARSLLPFGKSYYYKDCAYMRMHLKMYPLSLL